MGNVPCTILLKKTAYSSSSGHQLPVAPHLDMVPHAPLSCPEWSVDWLDCVQDSTTSMSSCMQQPLSCPANTFLLHSLLPPALAFILFLLPQWRKPWQEWLWYRCPSELHSYLFSVFWPVVSLCVNYCLPYKEASVMRGWLLDSFMGVNIAIYLGVSVIPYPFSNIKVLGLMTSPTIGLWPCL